MAGECLIEFTYNGPAQSKERLDVIVAARHPELSRNAASRLIREGSIRVDNKISKPGYKPLPGERISGLIPAAESASPQESAMAATGSIPADAIAPDDIPPENIAAENIAPENIPIDILFEDAYCLALNKPPGLVVHPAPGHSRGTLVNALLHHRPEIRGTGSSPDRPGIVHRLDKDTSGLLLVAKPRPPLIACLPSSRRDSWRKNTWDLSMAALLVSRGALTFPSDATSRIAKRCPPPGFQQPVRRKPSGRSGAFWVG